MTTEREIRHRHFVLEGITQTEPFRSRGMGPRPEVPFRGRQEHSRRLSNQLSEVAATAETAVLMQRLSGISEGLGLRVEFESFPA